MANLAGAAFAGTLTRQNAGQLAGLGALAGAAAVITAGTGTIAASGSLLAPLGSGLTGAIVGGLTDVGLSALLNPPDQLPPAKQPQLPQQKCP